MNKTKLKEQLAALDREIINETIDIPDNALITLSDATTIFTKKRLELIETIKSRHPQSVQELAKMTKRVKQAVTRDLKILERFEIIRLEKKGRNAIPLVEREIVVLSLPRNDSFLLEKKVALGEAY